MVWKTCCGFPWMHLSLRKARWINGSMLCPRGPCPPLHADCFCSLRGYLPAGQCIASYRSQCTYVIRISLRSGCSSHGSSTAQLKATGHETGVYMAPHPCE
ncbi:hypothetical protein AVEN_91629-1 [Araneus ventricosus]|uniref:Uncharacterized protein n=1 Tax=Araneus ventricosus TaxID=182803 RepID=A0A4Y2EY59_ARAVE|nr:hypothetical protein AVEN_91629-1 [Araneus ventricosus]